MAPSRNLLFWPLLFACGGMPEPCLGARSCPTGHECLASRCVLEGGVPVEAGSDRVLLAPVGVALATREKPSAVGPSVTLGNPAISPSALYVRFPRLSDERPIDAAFLLLEPTPGSLAGPDVELEIWRTSQAWSGDTFSWSKRPRVTAPAARAIARSIPPSPVRADVTELLRDALEHPDTSPGFAILARQTEGAGVTLETGLGSGPPPRLDVYFAPKPRASHP